MEDRDFWKRFEESGNILDYLNYTACTNEESQIRTLKEGERGGSTDYGYWNGVSRHASW